MAGTNQTIQIEAVNQYWTPEVQSKVMEFIYAPMNNPDLLTAVTPLILGGFVMDLYFGKHKKESLGWNTSVGNAVLWVATGISMLMSHDLAQPELYAVYGLIGIGSVITFMDFFHIWPSTVAFLISSSAVVYTLAYTLVVIIKAGMGTGRNTLIAAGIFLVGINIVLKLIKGLETNQDDFKTNF